MMLRGLWKLVWIEIKVFLREPLGAIGTMAVPVLLFVVSGRVTKYKPGPTSFPNSGLSGAGLPVLVSLLIAVSAVLSLVTIISIYREGGILKRLRATPLRPYTILTAHVIVKLLLTAATLTLMLMAGRRYFPPGAHVPWFSFTVALMISTWSILSVGFLIASIVPTARFAQPIGAVILYPMFAVSGLFVPVKSSPASTACCCSCPPTHLRCKPAQGDLERRRMDHPHGRCFGADTVIPYFHDALGKGLSLGIATLLMCPQLDVLPCCEYHLPICRRTVISCQDSGDLHGH
jgi:ABC-2 type transport system permease protein